MHNYNHDMLQQEKQSHLSSQLYTTNTQKEPKSVYQSQAQGAFQLIETRRNPMNKATK